MKKGEYIWILRDLYIYDEDVEGSRKGVRYKTIETALAAARKAATRYHDDVVMIEIHRMSIGTKYCDERTLVYSTPSGPTPEELDIRIPDRHGMFSWIVRELKTGKSVTSGSGHRSVREAVRAARSARMSLLSYMCGESVYEIYEDGKLVHVQDEYLHDLSDMDIEDLDYDQKHYLDRLITVIGKGQRKDAMLD